MDTPPGRSLRAWLREAAAGEEIIAVTTPAGGCISWSGAAAQIEVELTLEFTHKRPLPVYAWTLSRVIFLDSYDGWPQVRWLPRDPSDDAPELGGFEA